MQLSRCEKEKYIELLTPDLVLLRKKANISQDELANIIGTSRQNYGAIERCSREMTWNTYLALIFFYNSYSVTKDFFKMLDSYPRELFDKLHLIGDENIQSGFSLVCTDNEKRILDNQAIATLKSLLMVEIIRCNQIDFEEAEKIVNSMIVKK